MTWRLGVAVKGAAAGPIRGPYPWHAILAEADLRGSVAKLATLALRAAVGWAR